MCNDATLSIYNIYIYIYTGNYRKKIINRGILRKLKITKKNIIIFFYSKLEPFRGTNLPV